MAIRHQGHILALLSSRPDIRMQMKAKPFRGRHLSAHNLPEDALNGHFLRDAGRPALLHSRTLFVLGHNAPLRLRFYYICVILLSSNLTDHAPKKAVTCVTKEGARDHEIQNHASSPGLSLARSYFAREIASPFIEWSYRKPPCNPIGNSGDSSLVVDSRQ